MVDKPTNVPEYCRKFGIDPRKGRAHLRIAGLKAPYTLDKRVRELLRQLKAKPATTPISEVRAAA